MVLLQGTKGVAGRAGDDAPEKQAGINDGQHHTWPRAVITESAYPIPPVQCWSWVLFFTPAISTLNTLASSVYVCFFFLIKKKNHSVELELMAEAEAYCLLLSCDTQ